jgi:hypothetical protein
MPFFIPPFGFHGSLLVLSCPYDFPSRPAPKEKIIMRLLGKPSQKSKQEGENGRKRRDNEGEKIAP